MIGNDTNKFNRLPQSFFHAVTHVPLEIFFHALFGKCFFKENFVHLLYVVSARKLLYCLKIFVHSSLRLQ
jgi:hypothetical protein